MAITAVCPACRAAYQLSEQQEGKKVRCKQCDAVFVVVEAPARRTTIRTPVAPPPPPARPTSAAVRRGAAPKRSRDDDEDARDQPRRKAGKSFLPWILGCGMVAFGLLLLVGGGGAVIYLLVRDKAPEMASKEPPAKIDPLPLNQPVVNPPVVKPLADQPIQGKPVAAPPEKEVKPPPPPVEDAPRNPAPANNGRLGGERLRLVKAATVYLEVTMPDGSRASGSGFFGCKEARNIILTNAHVVGMLSPDSIPPRAIDVFVHSGQPEEWKTTARVLGVDRSSDLAVLDIGTPLQKVPQPLTVKSAGSLTELDEVYVSGFPLGKALGKEISIRDSKVASLRKKGGVLDRVQLNGGMDPGNSGGPVVDNNGHVVGVAVSGIPGRQINFAIPGDHVHVILNGRIAGMSYTQPYYGEGNKLIVPSVMNMIDPRNLIKEVGVDIWTGDKPADPASSRRPSAVAQPPAQAGDSPHAYYRLTYRSPEGTGEIALPELPPGKVYWQQPKWVNAKGETHWVVANPLQLPAQPVYREPVNLVLRYPVGTSRPLDLLIDTGFKVSNDDDSDNAHVRNIIGFTETVTQAGAGGSVLTLRYRGAPKREILVPGKRPSPSGLLEQIKPDLPRLSTTLQIDNLGNITRQTINERALMMSRVRPQQIKLMKGFHEIVQQGLESLSVSLPASGTAKPLESWTADRHLPIDTPGKYETGKLEVTFTYLGVRTREGRKEAVLSMHGHVRGKGNAVNGKATGTILVDVATGQTILAESTVVLQLDAVLSEPGEADHTLRVIATMRSRMQRKL
jgi:predicted Zn finger-like uncharacterized protein